MIELFTQVRAFPNQRIKEDDHLADLYPRQTVKIWLIHSSLIYGDLRKNLFLFFHHLLKEKENHAKR